MKKMMLIKDLSLTVFKNPLKVICLMVLLCIGLACKKNSNNEIYPDSIIYIKGAEVLHDHVVEPWNDGNFVTLNFSGAYTAVEDLFGQAPADIDVAFKVDLDQVESYNTTNGTDYLPLPATGVNASTFTSTIEQGEQETPQLSVTVDITAGLLPFTTYLLPISIEHISGNQRIDERKKTIYFKVFIMDNTPVEIKVGILTNTSGNMDMSKVASIANPEDPDILVVREMDKGTTRSGGLDKADELKNLLLIKNYRFSKHIDLQGGEFGFAVYSRYPIKNFSQHILTSPGAATNRGLGIVELDVHGQTLKVAFTQLDFQSVGMLDNLTSSLGHIGQDNTPIVYLGSFQQNPNLATSTVYQSLFGANFMLPCQVCPPTYGHPIQTSWTDMIVFRPQSRFEVVETNNQTVQVLSTSVANSPHKPVFTTLEVYFYADKD